MNIKYGYVSNIALSSSDIFSSSYYDDYSFLSLGCFSRLSSKLAARPLPAHKTTPRGLPTGSWTKLLGAVQNSGLVESETPLNDSIAIASRGYLESTSSVLCYDSRDRLTATATADHLGGLCLDTSVYNDAAMPLTTTFTRWPLLTSESTETHSYSYTYDALARVSSVTLVRGDSVYTVERNTYDAIGRLTGSARGNGCTVAYSYKPSGAVASVSAKNTAGEASFLQSLRYATGATPSYSGNVGSVDWSGDDKVMRRYGFRYDGLGRLVTAAYSEPGGRPSSSRVSGAPSYSTTYTYGADSRPLKVRRQGVRMFLSHPTDLILVFGEVDNLEFTYTGSRLTKVDDSAAAVIYSGASDFNDGADAATEYTYDSDGRLTSDANKGITSIRYNAIGLPAVVTFADGSSITNRYGADGSLLQRVKAEPIKSIVLAAAATPVIRPTTTTVTDNHIGPLTIRKTAAKANSATTALARIDTPSGYIADGRMHYYVKDYQGNVRQVTDADGKVEQDNHYYPYGMLMAESSDILSAAHGATNTSNSPNPYLYGGKEYLTTGSANLLDFTARTYDPTTILFHTQDPKAIKFTTSHTYLYCEGDPINMIDPDGRDALLLFDGSVITVKAVVFLTGEHANEEYARMCNEDIRNTWGSINKFSYDGNTYDVKWDVSVRVKGDEPIEYNGINNYMKVIMEPENNLDSYVRGTNNGNLRAYERYNIRLNEDFPLSHEFGHILGLIDRYQNHKPDDGWMNDIMAEPTYQIGRIISNHHLETLFKPILELHKVYDILRNLPIINTFVPNMTKYWINYKTRPEKIEEPENEEL